MSKTTIYFVRHGQTEWNVAKRMQGHQDSPLTEQGILQAEKLSAYLQNIQFDEVFSSPSLRAYKTAEILNKGRTNHIIPVHELKEINLGDIEGQVYSELLDNADLKQYAIDFRENPEKFECPNGESFIDLRNRVMPFFNDTLKIFKGKTILIVSHTCTIKTILNTILTNPIKNFWHPMIAPTSFSIVEANGNKIEVLKYGSTAHLGEDILAKGPF